LKGYGNDFHKNLRNTYHMDNNQPGATQTVSMHRILSKYHLRADAQLLSLARVICDAIASPSGESHR
jgi:serine/threonine protein kinase HipA of HipAB toxin-antitoxin module